MDDHDHYSGRFAELQQRWHGWGAPVGAGIALLSLGGFLVLLAQAWSPISRDDPLQRPDARGRGGRPGVNPTRRLDPKEITMDPHDPDEIAAAWTVLALHACGPGSAGLLAPEAARADLVDGRQVVVPAPPPWCPAASIPARPGEAIASVADLQRDESCD